MERHLFAGLSGRRIARHSNLSGMDRSVGPQEQWEWPIAVYLFLAGTGAGAFVFGILVKWLVAYEIPSNALLLWGPLLVALGAPFLVLDLGRKKRFINACLNPASSWASRGFAILTSLIMVGAALFFLSAAAMFSLRVPEWLSTTWVLRGLEVAGLALSLGTAVYTGVFLKSVKTVSMWNTWSLPLLFLGSALSTGAIAVVSFLAIVGAITRETGVSTLASQLLGPAIMLILIEGLALAWLLRSLSRGARMTSENIRHLAFRTSPSLLIGFVLALSAFFVRPANSPLHTLLVCALWRSGLGRRRDAQI